MRKDSIRISFSYKHYTITASSVATGCSVAAGSVAAGFSLRNTFPTINLRDTLYISQQALVRTQVKTCGYDHAGKNLYLQLFGFIFSFFRLFVDLLFQQITKLGINRSFSFAFSLELFNG